MHQQVNVCNTQKEGVFFSVCDLNSSTPQKDLKKNHLPEHEDSTTHVVTEKQLMSMIKSHKYPGLTGKK